MTSSWRSLKTPCSSFVLDMRWIGAPTRLKLHDIAALILFDIVDGWNDDLFLVVFVFDAHNGAHVELTYHRGRIVVVVGGGGRSTFADQCFHFHSTTTIASDHRRLSGLHGLKPFATRAKNSEWYVVSQLPKACDSSSPNGPAVSRPSLWFACGASNPRPQPTVQIISHMSIAPRLFHFRSVSKIRLLLRRFPNINLLKARSCRWAKECGEDHTGSSPASATWVSAIQEIVYAQPCVLIDLLPGDGVTCMPLKDARSRAAFSLQTASMDWIWVLVL